MSDTWHVLPETKSPDRYTTPRSVEIRADRSFLQYEKLVAANSSVSATSTAPSEVAKQIRGGPVTTNTTVESSRVRQAQQAIKLYKMSKGQKTQSNVARCPVSHRSRDPEDLERDFTTPGVQGTLGCPFARMADGMLSPTHNDPIAAEFHQDKASTLSPPMEQPPGKCPIRFLDQHSPEEVAKYFENHKHEIPRSHEICVKRYGGNESSARQLDAKYGNLVNMIQGLGVKHKAYLPEKDRIEERDKCPTQGVERWAEDISQEPEPPVHAIVATEEEEPRPSRFEKPLREIRVGESPSRPWGISVPADNKPTPSALQGDDGDAHLNRQSTSSHPGPVAKPNGRPVEQNQSTPQQTRRGRDSVAAQDHRTHVAFNGPVFFGYSAEEVASLLKTTNLGSMKPGGI